MPAGVPCAGVGWADVGDEALGGLVECVEVLGDVVALDAAVAE